MKYVVHFWCDHFYFAQEFEDKELAARAAKNWNDSLAAAKINSIAIEMQIRK
jgi:hypothetical protein